MDKMLIFCFLTIIMAISVVQVNAQTDTTNLIIGGNTSLDFSSLKNIRKTGDWERDGGQTINLDFTGQIGLFVHKNLMLGIGIPFSYSKQTDAFEYDAYTDITTSISLVPFIRCYIGKGKLKPYLHSGFGMGRGSNKYFESNKKETKVPLQILAYEIGGGLSIFLSDHLAIDLNILYGSATITWTDPDLRSNEKNKVSGVGSTLGILVCL
jgi:opacity protein-like surface antigen